MKRYFPIILIVFLSVSIIGTLILAVGNPHVSKRGGFNRMRSIQILPQKSVLNAPGLDFIEFAGRTNNSLFFYHQEFGSIIRTSLDMVNKSIIKLKFDTVQINEIKSRSKLLSVVVRIDSPFVTIFFPNSSCVLTGNMNDTINKKVEVNKKYSDAARVSDKVVVIKAFDSLSREFLFKKINLDSGEQWDEKNITARIHDGGFSESGTLHYDVDNKLFFYPQYYRNNMVIFDTNLNVVRYCKTIDTFSHYKVKSVAIGDKKNPLGFTLKEPPFIVNAASAIANNKIFINSLVLAENEIERTFEDNAVVDVYDLKSCRYLGSFYIPKFKGEKMRKSKVVDGEFIAIYRHYVVAYQLTPFL